MKKLTTSYTFSPMSLKIRKYIDTDLSSMLLVWNEVVREGQAFPQTEELGLEDGAKFFAEQSYCGVAEKDGEIVGLYILHPNNIGRCGHIANASYAVKADGRGGGIGRALVMDSLERARQAGFGILQFNAVVLSNERAHKLYENLGFTALGRVPGGFRRDDGSYEDIRLYYYDLTKLPKTSGI